MEKLLPEFQAIVDDACAALGFLREGTGRIHIQKAVTRCQALALRVPEMGDDDIDDAMEHLATDVGGVNCLDANAIQLLNTAPIAIDAALTAKRPA